MAKTCPNCEYVLGEFDDTCPRCAAAGVTKRAEAKTAEVKPAEVKPAEMKPAPAEEPKAAKAVPESKTPAAPAAESKSILDDDEEEETDGQDKPEPRFDQKKLGIGLGVFVGAVLIYFVATHLPKGPGPMGAPEIDVPSLVGLSSKELVDKLGKPDQETKPSDKEIENGADNGTMTWRKGERTVFIDYHLKKMDVVDIFISTSDPSGTTSNINEVKGAAQVSDNDEKYEVQPVTVSGEDGMYTGIRVVPKETGEKDEAGTNGEKGKATSTDAPADKDKVTEVPGDKDKVTEVPTDTPK